jgi:hypothetical protein
MSTVLFLSMRVLHVLLAAVWLGATLFTSYLLLPVVQAAGPAGGQVMIGLHRKGITPFFGAVGGITVLTGIYLYWHFTGGFDPEISRGHAGMAYGIGGVAGLIAVILGGSVVGRSSGKLVAIMEKMPSAAEAQKGALMQEAGVLRQRMITFSGIVLIMQVVALALMAVAHYI